MSINVDDREHTRGLKAFTERTRDSLIESLTVGKFAPAVGNKQIKRRARYISVSSVFSATPDVSHFDTTDIYMTIFFPHLFCVLPAILEEMTITRNSKL